MASPTSTAIPRHDSCFSCAVTHRGVCEIQTPFSGSLRDSRRGHKRRRGVFAGQFGDLKDLPRHGLRPVCGHFPPIPDSGPSAALRGRRRIWPDTGFRSLVSVAALAIARPRPGPVVRVLQHAVFVEVIEDGPDGLRFFDAGLDPYRTAAVDAGAQRNIRALEWRSASRVRRAPSEVSAAGAITRKHA